MTNIAVTAASGQLGSEIVRALTASKSSDTVIAIARTPSKVRESGVEIREGDYNDGSGFEHALKDVEVLLLVSGMAEPSVRIGQHRNVINAAKAAGVRKLVYTSVQGPEDGTAFSSVVQSNRQTEQDVRASGLDWVIGRNGIYIEPDIDYIDTYKALAEIANCAGEGKCGYTTREQLGDAYAQMLTSDACNSQTYNLHGEALTQVELADYINSAFGASLVYREMTVEEYKKERTHELGEFLGTVISGIYAGIRAGAFDNPSDYLAAAGRPHESWDDYFSRLGSQQLSRQ